MIATKGKLRVDAKHPRVTEALREKIVSGRYPLGSQLPHRDALELTLGASRATVQTALNTLLLEGFLRSVSGMGTFVSERPPFVTDYGFLFPIGQDEFPRHGFYAALHATAKGLAQSRGGKLHSYFGVTSAAGDDYASALSDCMSHRIAGLILAGVPWNLGHTPLLTRPADLPRVAIQQCPSLAFGGPSVYPNMTSFYEQAFARCVQARKKRVAVLGCDRQLTLITDLAAGQGLRIPLGRVLAIPPEWTDMSGSLIALLFALPPSERPDALIISDDNLVTDATAALLSLGLKFPNDLLVIAHANLPLIPKSHVPCEFLAFDTVDVMQACLDAIDTQRSARTPPGFTAIEPRFVPQSRAAALRR